MPEKGERSRGAMLDAARSVILEKGMEALTHSAVAARLELSKSAVHWHFPTKRDLLSALILEYVDHLKEEENRHEERWIQAGMTPQEAILPAMRDWFEDFRHNRRGWIGIGSALLGLSRSDPQIVEPIRAWYRDLYARIADSGLDRTEAFAAMMAFDGFFNASKLGILVIDPEEGRKIQESVLRRVFASRPELLKLLDEEGRDHS